MFCTPLIVERGYLDARECLDLRTHAGTNQGMIFAKKHALRPASFKRGGQRPLRITLSSKKQWRGLLFIFLTEFADPPLKSLPVGNLDSFHRSPLYARAIEPTKIRFRKTSGSDDDNNQGLAT